MWIVRQNNFFHPDQSNTLLHSAVLEEKLTSVSFITLADEMCAKKKDMNDRYEGKMWGWRGGRNIALLNPNRLGLGQQQNYSVVALQFLPP